MSLPRYPEYKDSGISWLGEMPAHWDERRTKYLFDLMKRPVRDEDEIVTAFRDGQVTLRGNRRTDGFTNALQEIGYQGVRRGDLVIHAMDAFAGAIGVSDSDGKSTPVYSVCRPRMGTTHSRYYAHVLRYMAIGGFIASLAKGIRERSTDFRWTDAGSLLLPMPPLEEQEAIVAFLDRETAKIDALIAEQEKLLALLAEKRQATISHAVTRGLNPDAPMKDSGIPWLGDVPAHWQRRKLLDLAAREQHAFVNGPFGSDLLTSELVTEGVPVIYIRDIKEAGYLRVSEWHVTSEKAAQIKFCSVIPGDLIIAKVGDPPGLAAVYPDGEPDGIVTQDVIRLRVDQAMAEPSYLRWLLSSDYGRALVDDISVESTRTRVGLGEYKQLRFFIPPVDEQEEIAACLERSVSALASLRTAAESVIELLRERRSALISAAVTGKIDVRHTT